MKKIKNLFFFSHKSFSDNELYIAFVILGISSLSSTMTPNVKLVKDWFPSSSRIQKHLWIDFSDLGLLDSIGMVWLPISTVPLIIELVSEFTFTINEPRHLVIVLSLVFREPNARSRIVSFETKSL